VGRPSRGPRSAPGDIGGEVRILFHYAHPVQSAQHHDHHQVADAEPAVEPLGVAKPTREVVQPRPDPILQHRQPLVEPALLALQIRGLLELDDRRLHRVQGREHPRDRARTVIRILRHQARMPLGQVEDDCP
jgi:hypothetical protein